MNHQQLATHHLLVVSIIYVLRWDIPLGRHCYLLPSSPSLRTRLLIALSGERNTRIDVQYVGGSRGLRAVLTANYYVSSLENVSGVCCCAAGEQERCCGQEGVGITHIHITDLHPQPFLLFMNPDLTFPDMSAVLTAPLTPRKLPLIVQNDTFSSYFTSFPCRCWRHLRVLSNNYSCSLHLPPCFHPLQLRSKSTISLYSSSIFFHQYICIC